MGERSLIIPLTAMLVETARAALNEVTPWHMKSLTAGAKPFIVRYDPQVCPDCQKLNPFWEMASQNFPPATIWRCTCAEHMSLCEDLLRRSGRVHWGKNMPVIEAWTGAKWVRYFGKTNLESLLQWMHEV